MGDNKLKWGSHSQAITITLAGLADGAARQSNFINFSALDLLDIAIMLVIKTGAGAVSTGWVDVLGYGTVNDGTDFSDGATGSDSAIILSNPPNMASIGKFTANVAATTFKSQLLYLGLAFAGMLPAKGGIVVVNHTGAAFDPTEGNFKKLYQPVLAQY